jgi:non-heme chloroperoxidase
MNCSENLLREPFGRPDAAEYTAKMIPGAKLSVYQGIGHSPFFEDPSRFNAELAGFVRRAQK